MVRVRLFGLPLPILAAAAQLQVMPGVSGPGWFMGAVTAVFVVLWFLNAIGRLPGATGERRTTCFNEKDREKLAEVHRNVTREEPERPGWPMVWTSAREGREIRDLLTSVAKLGEAWVDDRRHWKAERDAWQQERGRLEARVRHLETIAGHKGVS